MFVLTITVTMPPLLADAVICAGASCWSPGGDDLLTAVVMSCCGQLNSGSDPEQLFDDPDG